MAGESVRGLSEALDPPASFTLNAYSPIPVLDFLLLFVCSRRNSAASRWAWHMRLMEWQAQLFTNCLQVVLLAREEKLNEISRILDTCRQPGVVLRTRRNSLFGVENVKSHHPTPPSLA